MSSVVIFFAFSRFSSSSLASFSRVSASSLVMWSMSASSSAGPSFGLSAPTPAFFTSSNTVSRRW
jgi:hypothetical protein